MFFLKSPKSGEKFQAARARSASLGGKLRQLSVKVIKATQLTAAGNRDRSSRLVDPCVVVEVDEPSQRFKTEPAKTVSADVVEWSQECTL